MGEFDIEGDDGLIRDGGLGVTLLSIGTLGWSGRSGAVRMMEMRRIVDGMVIAKVVLEVDGAIIKDPDTIKEAVQKFYEGLYKETEQWRLGLRLHDEEQLEVDGAIIKDPDSIKEAVQKFYEGLYKETEQWRLGLRLHDVSRITEEEQIWL
ncbi:hypothetical protein KY290_007474 [Solanum tuberosum]|uniref:Uncharacterized protein n=1 Tax=Solanum tuberosum TaxID=4113 RepID=A0ABQ7W5P0_SOLTU|nr:hypothetical protein KY290_007474 [Solanum tuberosum]